MNTSTRFAVAVHPLAVLADADACPHSSASIALSVTTNAVVIRRIPGSLRDGGMVSAQLGRGGGWRLDRPVDRISLGSIYRCVEDDPLLRPPLREWDSKCPIGTGVRVALGAVIDEVEATMLRSLDAMTLAEVLQRGASSASSTVPAASATQAANPYVNYRARTARCSRCTL